MNMRIIKMIIGLMLFLIPLIGCPDPGGIPYLIAKLPLGYNQSEVATWRGSKIWFGYTTLTSDNAVAVLEPSIQLIKVGNQPVGIAVWQNGNRVYAINNGGLSISVIAVSDNESGDNVVDSITNTSFHNMGDAVVTADGRYLYVATDTNAISVISTTTDKVVTTFTDPSFNYPAHLVADAFNRYVFVSESRGNAVSVISTTTNTVVKTIGVGISPNGMAQTPDGNWLFVVNSGSNNISVIDVNSLTVSRTVTDTSFNNPQRIALTYKCAYGLVSEYNSGNVSLISQDALITGSGPAVIEDVSIGKLPYDIGVLGPTYENVWPSEVAVTLKGENNVVILAYPLITEIKNICF